MNSHNKYDFNSFWDTERIGNSVNGILNNNYSGETNTKLCYSTFLGEKEEKSYTDLLASLVLDLEFKDIYLEFKSRESIQTDFDQLIEEKQLKSQKDQVIDEYWKLKSNIEERQKIAANSQIEKYKNEAYAYKCERDELKQLFNNLKARKDIKEKEIDKLNTKCKNLKEQLAEQDKLLNGLEIEKQKCDAKHSLEISELKSEIVKAFSQLNQMGKLLKEKEEENENINRQIDEFKFKYEDLIITNKELTERNIKLIRFSKHHMSNFSSQITTNGNGTPLEDLIMNDLLNEEHLTEKSSEYVMSMKIGEGNIKSYSKDKRISNFFPIKIENKPSDSADDINNIIRNSKDPNCISSLIEGEEAVFGSYDAEERNDTNKSGVNHSTLGTKLNNNIRSIHHYESQVSITNSDNYSYNNNFVTINDDTNSEVNSNVSSSNVESEYNTEGDEYDTLRRFHRKSDLEDYGSNNFKY